MVAADEESRRAIEVADVSKEEGIVVMPKTISDPPEAEEVEAAPRIGKRNPPRNAGIVARKATRRASPGRSAPIQTKPDSDSGGPNKEIGNGCTMLKDPKKSERGLPS